MPKAKKKSKFDPKQLFTIMTVSRETIADMLNSAAELNGNDIQEFTPDDPRLTDKVCHDVADSLYDAYCNAADDQMDEAEQDVYISALEQFEEAK